MAQDNNIITKWKPNAASIFRGGVGSVVIVLISLAISALFILAIGKNPLIAYYFIIQGSFGSPGNASETLRIFELLLLTGLSFYVPLRSGVWNVGAEGQLYLGAIGATIVALWFSNLGVMAIFISLIVGGIFGAIWAAVPGFLKARLDVDEVVTTILLNPVALLLVDYLVTGPLNYPAAPFPQSPPVPQSARLPPIFPGVSLDSGILLSLMIVVATYVVLSKSELGFQIRMLGGNRRAAEYAGIRASELTFLSMLWGGGMAGLAGAILILGKTYFLNITLSAGYGYTGIVAATLVATNPLYIILSSFFLAVLQTGGNLVNIGAGIPVTLVNIISALIVIMALLREYISRRLKI